MIPDNGHQFVVLTFSDAYGCLSGHHGIHWGAGVYGLLVKWWFFIKVNIFLNILVAFCVAMIHLMGSEVTPILCSDACLCRKITEQLLYLRFWNILYTDNVNILLNIITQTIISFRYISDNYQECMADRCCFLFDDTYIEFSTWVERNNCTHACTGQRYVNVQVNRPNPPGQTSLIFFSIQVQLLLILGVGCLNNCIN